MGKDPDAIRKEIERTREGMAGTVDALAYKTDVKERTKDKARNLASKPKDAVLSIKDTVMGTVHDRTPDLATMSDARGTVTDTVSRVPGQVTDGARRVGGVMRENPLGLAIGGLAVGFVAGLLIPSTDLENERLGPIADQLKDSAKESGQELFEHGKEMAQVAAGAAQEAVKDNAPDMASDMASSAQDKARDLQGTAVGSSSSNGMGY